MSVDANDEANESFSSLPEYRLPLNDSSPVVTPYRRSRTLSGSSENSSISLDAFFDVENSKTPPALPFSVQATSPPRNRKQQEEDLEEGSRPVRDTPPLQPTRQRPSVTFEGSERPVNEGALVGLAAKHDNHFPTETSIERQSTKSSPWNKSKNRSLEIRMDGHVLELTQTEDGENITTLRETTSGTPVQESLSSTPLTRKHSLSYDSDEAMDFFDDGSKYPMYSTKKFPGPSSVDSTDDSFLSGADQTTLSTSSPNDAKSTWKTSNFQDKKKGGTILEENRRSGISFDDSDASNTTGTRFGIAFRFRDVCNFRIISLILVKSMPCFWLCCFKHNNELHGSAFPDRFVLARLNILSFIFSTVSVAACLWLCIVLFLNPGEQDETYSHEYHFWNNNGSVAAIGSLSLILLFTCFWTIRIVKEVDLVAALRSLWLLLWILPIAALLNISAFDYNDVTSIWVRHYWNSMQLWWFREQFCAPDTADTLCTVPIGGGADYEYEDDWCFERHNTTTCTEIRDEAQDKTIFFLLVFYRALASWGCVYMFVIFLIIKCLERIISKPMVQKSREVNVVGWLTFPVLCTAVFGGIYLFSPYAYLDSLNEQRWGGYLYLIAAGLFVIALLMGWCLSACSIRSNTDKQNKSTAALILIGVLFINAFVLVAIFVMSIIWSHYVELSDRERSNIACTMSEDQCTNCDALLAEDRCPEWSEEDITQIVCRQLKQSAALAAIFIVYDLNVMKHGLNVRKHLSMYQIDYV